MPTPHKPATGKDVKNKAAARLPFPVRMAIFCLLVLGVIYFPTTVLFCGCMLPTFVAALVDNQPVKTAGFTVGACNLAGTIPAGLELWEMGSRIEHSFALLLQPGTLLLAYVAAAIGWLIYFQVPQMVAGVLIRRNERRLKDIDKRQTELVRKWGGSLQTPAGSPAEK